MIDYISKEKKLPKGCGYVLSSRQLGCLLEENDITIHTDLIYFYSKEPGALLYADYWRPNNHIPYYRIYMQSGTVLSGEVFAAKRAVEEVVLPEFIAWVKYVLELPENSTLFSGKCPAFSARFVDGKVEIEKDMV